MAPVGVSWFALMFFYGAGIGLPVGIPPGPEDPMLAAVAPQECLFYTSWAGTVATDPKSKNQTERLLAEPEVRQFARQVENAIRAGVLEASRRQSPHTAVPPDEIFNLAKLILTRPAAVFLQDLKLRPPMGGPGLQAGPPMPEIHAGAIFQLGDDLAKVKAELEKNQETFARGAAEDVQIEGDTWHRLKVPAGAPSVTWGTKGKSLIVGIGDGTVEEILKRSQGKAPAWLADIRKRRDSPSVHRLVYQP